MSEITPITVGQTDGEYAMMKAAYYWDFYELRNDADTLPQWIGHALRVHADRSKQQRRDLHVPFERDPLAKIKSRRYQVPADDVAVMRAAAALDRHPRDGGPLALSESAWARDAIAAAVAAVAAALTGRGLVLEPMTDPLPRGRLRR